MQRWGICLTIPYHVPFTQCTVIHNIQWLLIAMDHNSSHNYSREELLDLGRKNVINKSSKENSWSISEIVIGKKRGAKKWGVWGKTIYIFFFSGTRNDVDRTPAPEPKWQRKNSASLVHLCPVSLLHIAHSDFHISQFSKLYSVYSQPCPSLLWFP